MSIALAKYDAACHMLAECKSVDEVKEIRDDAAVLKAYAKIAKNKKLEADAAAIRARAERCLGKMMEKQAKTVGLAKAGRPLKNRVMEKPDFDTHQSPVSLAEAGIDKNLADRARKLAAMPEKQFEEMIEETQQNIINDVAPPKPVESYGKAPVSSSQIGTFSALGQNWDAASQEERDRFVVDKKLGFPLGSMKGLIQHWAAATPEIRDEMRLFINSTPKLAKVETAKPKPGTDQFGRARPAPGSLLKAKH